MNLKNIGLIGLGKMGSQMGHRILASGLPLFVYDSEKNKIDDIAGKGGYVGESVLDLAQKLAKPRVILLSVPAGKTIDEIIEQLTPHLDNGDTIIDFGNSYFKDSQKRANDLAKKGVFFIDVGVSGGPFGARHGACLMIGGNASKVSDLDYLFMAISRDGAYEYFGKSGSGHLVKGFHNLIEYGYLQSLAEGLESLRVISENENMEKISLERVCDVWSKGSIIESRILLDAKKAFKKYPTLDEIDGSVYGQTLEEMKNLTAISTANGVKLYSCAAAVRARIDSQENPTYCGKIINAIRNIFGGHTDWNRQ